MNLSICTNDFPDAGVPGLDLIFYAHVAWWLDSPQKRVDRPTPKETQLAAWPGNLAMLAQTAAKGGKLGRPDNQDKQTLKPNTPLLMDWEFPFAESEIPIMAGQASVLRTYAGKLPIYAFGMRGPDPLNLNRSAQIGELWAGASQSIADNMRAQMAALEPIQRHLSAYTAALYPSNQVSFAHELSGTVQVAALARKVYGQPILGLINPYWSYPDGPGTAQRPIQFSPEELSAAVLALDGFCDRTAIWASSWKTIDNLVMKTLPLLG